MTRSRTAHNLSYVDFAPLRTPGGERSERIRHRVSTYRTSSDAGYVWCLFNHRRTGRGATGKPLFYPRSAVNMRFALEEWCRLWRSVGCGPGTGGETTVRELGAEIRNAFELTPEIAVVDKESLPAKCRPTSSRDASWI